MTVLEAQQNLEALLHQAAAGESVVITMNLVQTTGSDNKQRQAMMRFYNR